MNNRTTYHAYVRFADADRYVRAGWLPLPSLDGTCHGDWSVHMAWLCDCPLPILTPDAAIIRS